MTDKWTPGPWSIDERLQTMLSISHHVDGNETRCIYVCDVESEMDENSGCIRPTEQQQANAHLIVAAPELYEALEQAVTSMQDSGYQNTHPAVRAARAALAKARGES